jgi:hypothetical protein
VQLFEAVDRIGATPKTEMFDNHICDCAEYGDADFIVTLNPKDFPQASLRAKVISPSDPLPGRRTASRRSRSA